MTDIVAVDVAKLVTDGDWSHLSDDELSLVHDDAVARLQDGLLRKCKSIWQYRENHSQAWGTSWVENAYERFGHSRRTLEGLAGFFQAYVTSDAISQENIAPIAESRSLVQFIGRRNAESATESLIEAVAYVAEYGEAPTVAALAHTTATGGGRGVTRLTVDEFEAKFAEWPDRVMHRNNLNKGFAAFCEYLK